MRYLSVCSGVEAATLAWEPLGWEPVAFSEIEPFPCAVLNERWPNVPNLGDMTKITKESIDGDIDLLVGGTPCQGLSISGLRRGLDDPRSVLALKYCELLDELHPEWFVWENVPGALSNSKGADFAEILSGMCGCAVSIPTSGWRNSGIVCGPKYSVAWRVLDVQYTRVDGFQRAIPQRRKRVFVVGHSGADWRCAAAVLFERGGLLGDTPPRRETRETAARSAGTCLADGGGQGIAPNVSGFCPQEGRMELSLLDQHSPALSVGQVPGVLVSGFLPGQGDGAGGIGYEDGCAPTLRAGCDTYGVCYSLHPRADAGDGCGPNGKNYDDTGASFTLDTGHAPMVAQVSDTVCFTQNDGGRDASTDVSPTMRSGGDGGLPNLAVCFIQSQNEQCYLQEVSSTLCADAGVHTTPYVLEPQCHVRRLTPLECERLTGFPDDHTRIPWKGKPAEDCPIGHRYKACGNSMGVNVMRWIGTRIQMVSLIQKELGL